MRSDEPEQRVTKSVAAAALFAGLAVALPARADTAPAICDAPLDLIRLANPLPHFAKKLTLGEPVTIVAIGSSSTAGAGASSPTTNYPSQLAIELQSAFPEIVDHDAQSRRRRRRSPRHARAV